MPTSKIENLDTERIAHIMSVALNEFVKHDYHTASFNRIIKSSGMSKGTMYYYFESKEDLYLTLLNACKKEFGTFSQIQVHDVKSSEEFWERMSAVIDYVLKELVAKKTLGQFIYTLLGQENRSSSSPGATTIQDIEDWMTECLLTGQLVGAIRRDLPVELLLKVVWSVWEIAKQWDENSLTPEGSGGLIIDLLRRNLECTSKSADQNEYLD